MSLLEAFRAWCAGDASGYENLDAEMRRVGERVTRGYAHQGVSVQDCEDYTQTLYVRLYGDRRRKLEAIEDQRGAEDHSKLVGQAALRGATALELERALGRPLTDAEEVARAGAIDTDARVRSYLRQAFVNRFNRLISKPSPKPLADRLAVASMPPSRLLTAETLNLLGRILRGFEAWGNERSPGSATPGTRNMQSLRELEQAKELGLSATAMTRHLDPSLEGDALRRAAGARGRHWRRARERFHEYTDEVQLRGNERALLPEVRAAFDERFRIRRRPVREAVRKTNRQRPQSQGSE